MILTKTFVIYQENSAEQEIKSWFEEIRKRYEVVKLNDISINNKNCLVFQVLKGKETEYVICIPCSITFNSLLISNLNNFNTNSTYLKTLFFGKIDRKILIDLMYFLNSFE